MDEVIALEGEIRGGLVSLYKLKDRSKPINNLIADAEAIMTNKPTRVVGTRLDRLRQIVGQMRMVV